MNVIAATLAHPDRESVIELEVVNDEDLYAEAVADACREAALSFVNGVSKGWSKRDLGQWLLGPYARAVGARTRDELGEVLGHTADAEPSRLERLLADVRDHALRTVEGMPERIASLTAWARTAGSIIVRNRADGGLTFAPAFRPHMRLEDRVMSLVAVDILARPADYENRLAVCERCHVLEFDAASRTRGYCESHPDFLRGRRLPSLPH